MFGINVSNNFLTLARNASEADIRSIPYAGDAVWRDVQLMRTSLLSKDMLLSKPHIRKILKHSGSYIANMSAFYRQSLEVSDAMAEDADDRTTRGTSKIIDKASDKASDKATVVPPCNDTVGEKFEANTEEINEADGFAMVEVEETEKTEEIEGIVNALEGLSIQNLRTIKSLIKNVDWQ